MEMKVSIDFGDDPIHLGRLATRDRKIYFQYNPEFLQSKLEISPFHLKRDPKLFQFDPHLFEGLPGVFNDSLPDGWGRLLLDRKLRTEGVLPNSIGPLDRLSHVGRNGMGALIYEPYLETLHPNHILSLDEIADQSKNVLQGEAEKILDELILLNGSSSGARPKALIYTDIDMKSIQHGQIHSSESYEPWIVKFPNIQDGNDAGAIEYVYSLMAKEAGVEMPPTYLFPSKSGAGYFATKRFDRVGDKRFHVHTACGLLHSDYRTPSLDYKDLLALSQRLTGDIREVEKMFRIAVFNVLSHNRDDHSKNFSFLMDSEGEWKLSAAYDLTFSSGPMGEQSTMVMGNGNSPKIDDLVLLASYASLNKSFVSNTIEQTVVALSKWKSLAEHNHVFPQNIAFIHDKLLDIQS